MESTRISGKRGPQGRLRGGLSKTQETSNLVDIAIAMVCCCLARSLRCFAVHCELKQQEAWSNVFFKKTFPMTCLAAMTSCRNILYLGHT